MPDPEANPPPRELRHGRIALDPRTRQVMLDEHPARIGARGFDLLHALLAHPGEVMTKERLLDAVWPGVVVEESNLQVQVCALRRLLGANSIVTVPRRGYALGLDARAGGRTTAGAEADHAVPRPAVPGPMRGRADALASLQRQVRSTRLVTVVGAGGVGKTRLLQECVGAIAPAFEDGVAFTELAALARDAQVGGAIARALGSVDGLARTSVAEIVRLASGRHLLLVLENCEHVAATAGELVRQLLEGNERLHVLVTSQVPLKLAGEHLLRLPPLEVPTATNADRRAPALEVLADTLDALAPGHEIRAADMPDAVAICRHLDGVPLALEMAAAHVPMLGMAGVRRRLAHRFELLRAARRGVPPRHESLAAALAWSWRLLDARERRAMAALARFHRSFTVGMARQVLGEGGEGDAIRLLGRLIDKSFVTAAAIGGAAGRMRIAETTRLYALAQG